MGVLLVEVPVEIVSIDESASPDRDNSFILDHLVRYCSKFAPLPAITVSIERGTATVVRGHKYLIAARRLGRSTIRAVVRSQPAGAEVHNFLSRSDVMVLDWEAIKSKEEKVGRPRSWHVFYFERPLSTDEKRAFATEVRRLFSDPTIEVLHEDTGPVAEFEADTPIEDPLWTTQHLATFRRFSNERVSILSYQGRRFAGPGNTDHANG